MFPLSFAGFFRSPLSTVKPICNKLALYSLDCPGHVKWLFSPCHLVLTTTSKLFNVNRLLLEISQGFWILRFRHTFLFDDCWSDYSLAESGPLVAHTTTIPLRP